MSTPYNGFGKMLLTWVTIAALVGGSLIGYGLLKGVAAENKNNIDKNTQRLDKLETMLGDIRERTKGIEVGQENQTQILRRIERSLEGTPRR